MLQLSQIKMKPGYQIEDLYRKIQKEFMIKEEEIDSLRILKESIDARKKPEIYMILSVCVSLKNENKVSKRLKNNKNVSSYQPVVYKFPNAGTEKMRDRPVIVGSGPAGLFCAYFLAMHGYQPLLLERGKEVSERTKDVNEFWENGILNTESNVAFGEGGAGTFSDGKLNTLVHDKVGRNEVVLQTFVKHGAKENILYEAKPHIGTDILVNVVASMREQIKVWGGEVRFQSKVTDLCLEESKDGRRLTGVIVNGNEKIETQHCVLATGHSARDTFEMLHEKKIPMEAKSFAVGFRVIHPQKKINVSQYAMEDPRNLPPSPYKLTGKGENGRGVYSFCMCPGGYVVNASSEEKRTAVNGMSYSDRAGEYANSAIIVSVDPEDFGEEGPLAGIHFQRKLEEKAYEAGQGKIPIETLKDYEDNAKVLDEIRFSSDVPLKGQYQTADLSEVIPSCLRETFLHGMHAFDRKIHGFGSDDTILAGVESRTSSPVRVIRDDACQSEIRGLYPCGEGAGYAGGITSAAFDGMRVAEAIASEYYFESTD